MNWCGSTGVSVSKGVVSASSYEHAVEFICKNIPELLDAWNEACQQRAKLYDVLRKMLDCPWPTNVTLDTGLYLARHNARGLLEELAADIERYASVNADRGRAELAAAILAGDDDDLFRDG